VLVFVITEEVVVTMLSLVEGVLEVELVCGGTEDVVNGVVLVTTVEELVELDFDEPSARYAPTPTAAITTIITTTIAAAAIPLFFRLKPCLI